MGGGDSPPLRAWRRRADGRDGAPAQLDEVLAESGLELISARSVPETRATIDHLAVGPGGVTVIKANDADGDVTVKDGRLLVGARDRTRLVATAVRELIAVMEVLWEVHRERVPVAGAMCWRDAQELPRFRHLEVDGILIDGPRGVANLARRRGDLDADEIIAASHLLESHFPPVPA
jgi:hypothetical protein